MTADEIKAALTDRQAVALSVFGEARGHGLEAMLAVACVIRNRRARSPRFGGATWRGVCLAKRQFSCWAPLDGPANYAAVMAQAEALVAGHAPAPGSAIAACLWIADGVITYGVPDITKGADHYMTIALYNSPKRPKWANASAGAKRLPDIGPHAFFAAP